MEQTSFVLPGAVATYSAKSALFTAGVADRGTFFDSTGTFTITLSTTGLTAGWSAMFRTVSGTQTFDPTSTVTINNASTYAVSNAGDVVTVVFDGTNFQVSHTQRPATVAITGGTINGTTVGATTRATGAFTTVTIEDSAADNTITILSASDEGANRNATIPPLGGNRTFAMQDIANSFSNTQTFTGPVSLTTASDGITISKTTSTTLVVSSTDAASVTLAGGMTAATSAVFGPTALGSGNSHRLSSHSAQGGAATQSLVTMIATSQGSCTTLRGLNFSSTTDNSTQTITSLIGGFFGNNTKGAADTVNRSGGLHVRQQTVGANGNFGLVYSNDTGLPTVTGTWSIYVDETDPSWFGGPVTVASAQNVRIGTANVATNATDGFLYVPVCSGTPTGTPTALAGTAPIVVDGANTKLYFYAGGAWRDAGP